MNKVIYVTNTSVDAAFRYAHPRWHSEAATLYLFDYCVPGSARVWRYDGWRSGRPTKASDSRALSTFGTLKDVYETIVGIGRSDSQTLIELHFFTHGDPSCGVVVMPRGECTKAEFNRVLNKDSERGQAFAKAFHPQALVKLWGCAGVSEARQLALGYWKTDSRARRRVIQQGVEKYIRGMYAWRLSFLTDRTVWTAPPGWSSSMALPRGGAYTGVWDTETGPPADASWWRVAPAFVNGRGAEFYRRVLKAQLDPVGYVGVNDVMSKASEPAEILKAEATQEDPCADTCPA